MTAPLGCQPASCSPDSDGRIGMMLSQKPDIFVLLWVGDRFIRPASRFVAPLSNDAKRLQYAGISPLA
jgi:hypothetical protein